MSREWVVKGAGDLGRGAAIQMGGINCGTGAADISRNAAIQAAKLQALSSVMSTVGRAIAKDIEHSMAQRY